MHVTYWFNSFACGFSVLIQFFFGFSVLDNFFYGFAVSSGPQCPPPPATSTFTKSKFTCPVHWERLLPSVVSVLSFLYDCTASAFADSYSYNDSLVWKWTKFSIKSTVSFYLLILLLAKKLKKKNHQQAQCGSLSTLTFQKNNSLAFISFIVSYPFLQCRTTNQSPIASQASVINRRVVNCRPTRKVHG